MIAERFSKTLKNKIKKSLQLQQRMYILMNFKKQIQNATIRSTFLFNMKAIDFMSDTVMKYIPWFNKKESNFKVWYHARLSKK